MIVYVNKDDNRSFGTSPNTWGGNVYEALEPVGLIPGSAQCDPVTKVWTPDPLPEPANEVVE